MKHARLITAVIAIASLALGATVASATEGVSPGAVDRLAVVETRCPTFSWQLEANALGYELVAYRLPDDPSQPVELTPDDEALSAWVPAGATSWTPSAEQCFAPGGRYVWFVRAATDIVDDEVVETGEWSAGRFFAAPAGPTPEELARAVAVIRRWEAAEGGEALPLHPATVAAPASVSAAVPGAGAAAGAARGSGTGTGTGTGEGSGSAKSVPMAAAAIRGEHPALTGEAYGVLGISSAADGAGLAAAHLNGGPDLVLDGSADGMPDARVWEWGMQRTSAADQSFAFANPGAGSMHVGVEGTVTATGLDCPACVADTQLAVSAVTAAKIATGAVTSAKILDGSVRGADLADGAVTNAKIALAAVGADSIQRSAVTSAHLADGAVTSAHILDGTISAADISPSAALDADTLDGHEGSYYQPAVQIVRSSYSGSVDYLTTVCGSYHDVNVTASAPGTIVVTGEALINISASETNEVVYLAIGEVSGDCNDPVQWGGGPSELFPRGIPMTLTRVFTVPDAGTYSFHLNAKMHMGFSANTDSIMQRSLLAVFFPD